MVPKCLRSARSLAWLRTEHPGKKIDNLGVKFRGKRLGNSCSMEASVTSLSQVFFQATQPESQVDQTISITWFFR